MKTETEIVVSHEARRRIKLEAMKEVRVRMGIKEKYDEKNKEGTKERRKKGRANVKRCKNLCVEKGKKGRRHVTV